MKVTPHNSIERVPLNLRQGIKSSLPEMKALFSSVYLIYKISGESKLIYSEQTIIDGLTKIQLKAELLILIESFFDDQLRESNKSSAELIKNINLSPLFTAQLEALQVALELYWKLAKIDFEEAIGSSSERTGGQRFNKYISFSSNLDILDEVLSNDGSELMPSAKNLLFNMLCKTNLNVGQIEQKLTRVLTVFSEDTQFKIRIGEDTINFQQEGIYREIVGGNTVESNDSVEPVGPFRILKSAVKEGLNYYLMESRRDGFLIKQPELLDSLNKYMIRVDTMLSLTPKHLINSESTINNVVTNTITNIDLKIPRNKIIYGAPGTGKSYELRDQANSVGFIQENIIRVTFHPNYSYQQFVGSYKPTPIYKNVLEEGAVLYGSDRTTELENNRKKEPLIDYSFIEGPFLKLLVKALVDPSQNYLLIIEEINRAPVSSVFGDVFQLLDRKEDGSSEYSITFNEEAMSFLRSQGIDSSEIRIPNNLFIWATMNSADQGVMPLDAAFKRRWDFQYLPLDAKEKVVSDRTIKFQSKRYLWNQFRDRINSRLKTLGTAEDKLIGPFFMSANELNNEDSIMNKLLLYLRDDVVRHNPKSLFKKETYSDIIKMYKEGEDIFNDFDLGAEVNEANVES